MNQIKQIIGSLPRHVPSKPVSTASSGCQSSAEGLFRNGPRHLQKNIPKNTQSSNFTEDVQINVRELNDKDEQVFLYGKHNFSLFRNPNSSLDRCGKLEKRFHNSSLRNYTDSTDSKKALENNGDKVIKVKMPHTYAKMISDYSEAIERKKIDDKNVTKNNSYKKLLSRIPFDSVVSSLTRFERIKLGKAKVRISNSLSTITNRQSKDSSHALTDKSMKNENIKPISKIKKDSQKRDFFTKNSENVDVLNSDEKSGNLVNRIIEAREKKLKLEKPKNFLTMTNKLQNNFDVVNDKSEVSNEKKNPILKCVNYHEPNHKTNSTSISVNNPKSFRTANNILKNLNIVTSKDKVEIQIPINTEIEDNKKTFSKPSLVNVQISAKLQKKEHKDNDSLNSQVNRNHNSSIRIISTVQADSNNISKPFHLSKTIKYSNSCQFEKSSQSNKKYLRNEKGLPWWATNDHGKNENQQISKKATNIKDLYCSTPEIQILSSEELLPIDTAEALSKTTVEEQRPSSEQRPRWKRKLTTISKVMRHIEEEIKERRSDEKTKNLLVKSSKVKTKTDTGISLKKFQDNSDTNQIKFVKEVGNSSIIPVTQPEKSTELNKREAKNMKNVEFHKNSKDQQNKNKQNNYNIQNLNNKLKEITNKKDSFSISMASQTNKDSFIAIKDLTKNNDVNASNIIPHKTIQVKREKSNKVNEKKNDLNITLETGKQEKKEGLTDYGFKRKKIPDTFKPIEKKKDGTLIDYGLKVPTRKPKPKPLEKSSLTPVTIEKNIPKKTTSSPEQRLKNEFSEKKSYDPFNIDSEFIKKSNFQHITQTKSEIPLNKYAKMTLLNKQLLDPAKQKNIIEKEVDENLEFDATENEGKTSSDSTSGTTNNGAGALERNNNNNVGSNSNAATVTRSLVNRKDGILKFLNSEQRLNTNDVKKSESSSINFQDSRCSKLNVCNTESKLSFGSERSEKEFVYSAWLNRFHTRKHNTMIK